MARLDHKRAILADLERLISLKRARRAEVGLNSYKELYLKETLCTYQSPSFHLEMMGLLDKRKEGGADPHTEIRDKYITPPQIPPQKNYSRLLFIAPRGFAKSTICSRLYPLYLACFAKKRDIFLVSATISLAKENLRYIRNEIENNPRILEDFGDLKSEKWTEDMLILSNGVILRAKGRGFQIRGFRPDLIVCDDLEDEEVIYSKEQRDKLEHWFFRTLLPALKPEQDLAYVGTRLIRNGLIDKLKDKEEFVWREWKALTNEKSIWEEYWSTKALLSRRREMGTYAFEAEYQNNPLSLTTQPIKPHFLEGVKIGGEADVACLAIDPAISEKESSDYRAFTLFSRTKEGFKEVFSERGRWGIEEQIEKIIGIFQRYSPQFPVFRVILEEVAFQKIYRNILLDKSRERKLYIPVSTAELGTGKDKRPRDKMTRLLSVVHLFEQKLVQVVNPELVDELLSFPDGDYDDMVDATVYALYWLMNFRTGMAHFKEKEKLPVDVRKSFYVNEVRPGVFVTKAGEPPFPKQKTKFINLER